MNALDTGRLQELESKIEEGLRTFIDVGRCFQEIKETGIYKEKYGTFESYLDRRWGMSLNYADRLMKTLKTEEVLKSSVSCDTLPTTEAQHRKMEGLQDEQKRAVWSEAVKTAPGGVITAPHVEATRQRLFPRATKEESVQKGVLIHCPNCGHEWFIDS